jgi:hypothetical protein
MESQKEQGHVPTMVEVTAKLQAGQPLTEEENNVLVKFYQNNKQALNKAAEAVAATEAEAAAEASYEVRVQDHRLAVNTFAAENFGFGKVADFTGKDADGNKLVFFDKMQFDDANTLKTRVRELLKQLPKVPTKSGKGKKATKTILNPKSGSINASIIKVVTEAGDAGINRTSLELKVAKLHTDKKAKAIKRAVGRAVNGKLQIKQKPGTQNYILAK